MLRRTQHLFRDLFLSDRFFLATGSAAALFALSFGWPILFPVALAALAGLLALLVADLWVLWAHKPVLQATRELDTLLSLGDENRVRLLLRCRSSGSFKFRLCDELPVQLQRRDFELRGILGSRSVEELSYDIRPLVRGIYRFGRLHVFLMSGIGLTERRISFDLETERAVYPSIIQMKQVELLAMARVSLFQGIKRLRRLGHSYEFEQIKNYVPGDDYRSINWKATGRHAELMVNQYEDERSQQVYCIIDRGRSMKLPFGGMSLLDYAVNSSLVIANVALKKSDKAGLITFDKELGSTVLAERKRTQLRRILEVLYAEEEQPYEADFDLLYRALNKQVSNRSLLFLFTNFESMYALERALPVLRRIQRRHLLLVVIFENTEMLSFAQQDAESTEAIYRQTIARKFILEKKRMVQKAAQYGIQCIYSRPEDLSIQSVNKYLELKSRGLI